MTSNCNMRSTGETCSKPMTRNYLTIVPLNNAGRNKFLDEMFDRHKSRYGAQKWDYLGADVCEVCLAACIGCNPKTVQRARLRKDKSSLVFRYSVMLRSISAAQTQSGVRCAQLRRVCAPKSIVIEIRNAHYWANSANG